MLGHRRRRILRWVEAKIVRRAPPAINAISILRSIKRQHDQHPTDEHSATEHPSGHVASPRSEDGRAAGEDMPRESSPTRSEASDAATPSPTEPEAVDAIMSRILPFDERQGAFRIDFEELARLDLEDGDTLSPAMRQAIRVNDAYQLRGDRRNLEFRLDGIERVLNVDADDAERYVDWCGRRLEKALGDVYEQPGAVRQSLDSALEDGDFADVIESFAQHPDRWGALRISSPDTMTKHTIYEMQSCYRFGPRTASEGMRFWSRGTVAL